MNYVAPIIATIKKFRTALIVCAGILALAIFCISFLKYVHLIAWKQNYTVINEPITEGIAQFPVGVYPETQEIVEHPEVDIFFEEAIAVQKDTTGRHVSILGRVLSTLTKSSFYQQLAQVSGKTLVIQSGERKEQVSKNFATILGWTKEEQTRFEETIDEHSPYMKDGKYSPGTYVVEREATPEVVATLVNERFSTEVLDRYGSEVDNVVPIEDALTIASLLEREAYDFTDMRQISGVIWNRLFVGMRLQIDATLQYAKGSKAEYAWWPKVIPKDKYISSAYNTYKHHGLPPTPIANPSLEAILAALNPKQTECMYYFHDEDSQFHCTKTYEEHVALLKQYYGRGK